MKSGNKKKLISSGLHKNPRRDQVVSYALQAVERTAALLGPAPLEMMLAAMPLRALLIEGGQGYLNQTARSHNISLEIPLSQSDFLVRHFPRSGIKFGVTVNCIVWGKIVGGFIFTDLNVVTDQNAPLQKVCGSVSDFVEQIVIVVNGDQASRGDVIKYVANKVGFAHVEQERSRKEDIVLDIARSSFGFDDQTNIAFDINGLTRITGPMTAFSPRVDAVLMQIYVTCLCLMKTPQLQNLRSIIDV